MDDSTTFRMKENQKPPTANGQQDGNSQQNGSSQHTENDQQNGNNDENDQQDGNSEQNDHGTENGTPSIHERANGHQPVQNGSIHNAQVTALQQTDNSRPLTPNITESQAKAASKKYKHAFAIHSKIRTSPLTRETTEQVSLQGFKNLAFAVLACSILRLMIENLRKYGVRLAISSNRPARSDLEYGIGLYLTVPCHLFVAYGIELVAAGYANKAVGRVKKKDQVDQDKQLEHERRKLKTQWWVIAIVHAINATCNLLWSTWVVYYHIDQPGIGAISEMHAVIVWLKVCSYAFTNRDLRHAFLKPDPTGQTIPSLYKSCPYPQNITVNNLCYFWWAPTLVYQPAYPRTDKIRWSFVVKRTGEAIIACFIIWLASAQYAVPLLDNSLNDISQLRLLNVLERVLKLSTISVVCWLAGFYALFHSALNALAEFMRFGDREFYSDWWNCSDIRSYWTSWNKPVAHFMKRHVYAPMVGRGVPPQTAAILTFLFSAVLHEVLIGVPTHNVLGLAFAGMAAQIPMIFVTDVFRKKREYRWRVVGNLIFWCSFCLLGQPLAAMGYYFAWQAKYGNKDVEYPSMPALWPVLEK